MELQNGFAKSHHCFLARQWVGHVVLRDPWATYPIQRLAGLLQRGDTEFMSLTGFFAPDVIRFAMYLVIAFVLIKYSRMLAWLVCRDLLETRPTPASLEEASTPTDK
jgi:hypothetical protein